LRRNFAAYLVNNENEKMTSSYDARGHCILLTNSSGGLQEQYDYDAFGKPYFYNASGTVQASSAWGNRFLFTGREWMKELSLYDFRNRIYQSELGRFLQPDPKEFDAGDYNLYRYCHNDPVNKLDPDGQMALSKLAEKGIVKFLRTKTAHQLIAKGRNVIAGSKKEAVRAVEKAKPNSKAVFHTKDATAQKIGPHAQPQPRGGNTSHVFDGSRINMNALRNVAGSLTAVHYVGDNIIGQAIDFFSPLSIGQDVVDISDAFHDAAQESGPAKPGSTW
jgi:RHS repeat-associated protein